MGAPARSRHGGEQLERKHLRNAALGSVRVVTIARVATELCQFAGAVILARLVSPAQFGHAAIALIIQALVVATTAAGFGTPLVQRRSLKPEHVAAALAVVIVVGVGLGAATIVLAPLTVAPTLGDETARLVQLAALIFLVSPLGVVSHALLQRQLDFRRISIAEIASGAVGAAAAVTLALVGLDAAAVVLGVVFADLTLYTLFFIFAPPGRPAWHRREIREILAFGGPASLSSVLRSGFRNVDYAILGLLTGPATVGFYWRAFQLGVEYQRKISGIMVQVALPLYSRTAHISDMQAVRHRITRGNAMVVFPLLALLVVVAPVAIPWAFGPRWQPAVVPTQILAMAGLCATVMSGFGALILAVGRPRALLVWDAASLVGYAAAVYAAAPHGLDVLCAAVSASFLAQLLAAHVFLLRPLVGMTFRNTLGDVLPALVPSLALIAVAAPLFDLMQGAGMRPLPTMAATGAVGLCAYAVALRFVFRDAWADFSLLFDRIVGPRRDRGPTAGLAGRDQIEEAASTTYSR